MNPLVREYLDELKRETRRLPRGRREELREEIAAHLAEAIPPDASEADVRNALSHVGDPPDIAREERERLEITAGRATSLEPIAVAVLLVGGLLFPILGWLAGVAMVWASEVWSRRDKLIALLPPGGLGVLWLWFALGINPESCIYDKSPGGSVTREDCTGGWSTAHEVAYVALGIAWLAVAIGVAVHLVRRARS